MSEDQAPPPHGAESPRSEKDAPPQIPHAPAIGALGFTLIGGAVAAAVGLLVAVPLVRRVRGAKPKPEAKPKPTPQARRPRRKRTTD